MRSTQFRSSEKGWLRAAAARMLIATAAVGLVAGCGGDDNVRSTGDDNTDTQRIGDAIIQVVGRVVNSDGNPVEGVTVSVAGQQTETDATGGYVFEEVPATNVTGTDDNSTVGRPLTVSATPSADMALLNGGALVTPQAQIDNNTDDNLGTDGNCEAAGGGSGGNADVDGDVDSGTVSGGDGGDGGDCALSDSNGDGAITTFIDGLVAEAPIIVLARLNTTVEGTLKNNLTGAPIPNQEVVLDYQGPDNAELALCRITGNCSAVNAAPTFNLVATTGADGTFSITDVPDNSCLQLFVPRHDNVSFDREDLENDDSCFLDNVSPSSAVLSTGDDGGFTVALGGVNATPIVASGDTTPPVVANFGGILTTYGDGFVDVAEPDTSAGDDPKQVGLIREDIDGTADNPLVVTFSEPVPNSIIDGDAVLVRTAPEGGGVPDIAAGEYLTIASTTLSADGRTLTIVLDDSTPLAEGTPFAIYLARNAFFDTSGNGLVYDNDQGTLEDLSTVIPRPWTGATDLMNEAWVDFVVLCLKRVGNVNTDVDQVVANQVTMDPGTDNDLNPDLENVVSLQFKDVFDFAGADPSEFTSLGMAISQLNDATDGSRTPGLPGSSAEDREEAFAEALVDANVTVFDDVARVEFDPVPEATGYKVVVDRCASCGVDADENVPNSAFSPGGTEVIGGTPNLLVESNADGSFAVVTSNVRSGDTISITALDDLGNPSNDPPSVVTLVDNTRISPVLQRSYQTLYDLPDIANHPVCGRTEYPVVTGASDGNAGVVLDDGDQAIGEGGEQSGGENVAASVGAPCLGVSPELLIQPLASEGVVTPADPAYLEAFASLQAGNPDAIGDAGDIDGMTVFISDRWENRPAYDEEAYDDWGPQSRRMQIATSEDATIVNTPTTVDVSTTLSDFQEQNNTVVGNLEAPLIGDGIDFMVADILNFANADEGGSIVLTDNITDANGNAADLDVYVKDQWAPMMTEARREIDGSMTFVFNEDVVVPPNATLYLLSGDQTVTATIASADLDVTGNTITVDSAVVSALPAALFAEGVYMDGGADRAHFYVDSSEIEDTRGNKFEETSFDDTLADEAGLIDSPLVLSPVTEPDTPLDTYPVFVGVDLIGPFEVSVTTTDFQADSLSFTVTYNATHPIYLDSSMDMCNGGITPAGFLNGGTDDGGVLNADDFAISIANDPNPTFTALVATPTQIQFQVDVSASVLAGDTVDNVENAVSTLICGDPADEIDPPTQTAN